MAVRLTGWLSASLL